uniref:Uncharacterized protein n=1 Tax=Steinernema glaseri TaxID=37863 RepID=A0A1I7Z3W6_9BILA
MVLAEVFCTYFLVLLLSALCNAQIGHNPYAPQYQYNQQPFVQQQQPSNGQYHPQQQAQQFYRPGQGFDPQQGVQSSNGVQAVIPVRPKTGVVNKPVRTTQSDSNSSATVNVQLLTYRNPTLSLPDNVSCKCTPTDKQGCSYMDNKLNKCRFSFNIILSAKDQSVSFISGEFYDVPDNGDMSTGAWTVAHNLTMTSKPQSIDVIVFYNGIGFHNGNASIAFMQRAVAVDTFVAVPANYTPTTGNAQPRVQTETLRGGLVNSILQLRYSVKCNGDYKGQDCDLLCDPPVNTTRVICRNGQSQQSCTWDSASQQVLTCDNCLNGIDGTTNTCKSKSSNQQPCNPGVSPAFRTWTIVLGCLLGIAVVFIILLIVFYVIVRNQNERQASPRRTQQYQPPSLPLLHDSKDDEWDRSRTNQPVALGRTTHTDPESSRSSDHIESVRHANGVASPRREVAV